jgi:Mg2+ and Co2+ transporter CorA
MCFVDNSDLTFNPPVDDTLTGSAINICCQSASLLSTSLYGRLLDPEIMRLDALYAMHGLFTFALSAENQFLNCLRTKLKADSRRMNDSSRLHEILQNCIYHRGILRGRIDRLRAIEEAVLERGGPRWPSLKAKKAVLVESAGAVSQNTSNGLSSIGATLQRDEALATFQKQMTAVEAADASLLQDCSALLRKAEELLRLYKESIHDIRTTTSVLETQRAFEQSATVGRLTFLAFMFIPLSFTTSFFGMNFQDLGSGSGGKQLRIWVWFVVTIPVFACALVLLYWPSLVSVYQKLRIRKKAK